ncbi:sodium/pantothenate symporter [Heyndrickxia sporothermodurans]|uniref:sodium/pantothenate symporter n=1 Tax=Heyndrickxia sporothermodurans TaxID=46224 RepID=UPI002DB869D7|nr:sodium/pantothenate symporter [Heyndrickxia sporothermodurans]MEB6547802.1 sodium/pantothenate symporter [Heyndrickxia sporothermodurans]
MNIQVIIPLVIFLLLFFIVGLLASRYIKSTDSFIQEYFLGSRQMGGFILAMTMVATYGSGSSFIGGPGAAYNYGLAWVLLAMTQVVTGYFVLMVLGKKFAIISRKYNAITLIDFLKARYQSNWVTIIAAISIVIFLFSSMIAQWVGGARLMESILGVSYTTALFIFAVSVLIYVIIGGFRAVAITDTLQGIVMLGGTILLLVATLIAGGGIENIMADLKHQNPNLLSPYGADRSLTPLYISSFWILVGVGVVGLPQIAVRAMSYKNAKAMHRAILIGTIVIGIIMFGMHLIGVLARAIVPGIEDADTVMPIITMKVLPAWAAGIVLAAPMAAIMSTVNSVLILVSSAIVKDLYIGFINKEPSIKKVKQISFFTTSIIGIAVLVLAIHPPDLLIWLNLFSFGGLEAVFIWPIVMGLYWKNGNKYGAISSMIIGMGLYIYFDRFHPNPFGMHTVVIPILCSLLIFIFVSLFTKNKATL